MRSRWYISVHDGQCRGIQFEVVGPRVIKSAAAVGAGANAAGASAAADADGKPGAFLPRAGPGSATAVGGDDGYSDGGLAFVDAAEGQQPGGDEAGEEDDAFAVTLDDMLRRDDERFAARDARAQGVFSL